MVEILCSLIISGFNENVFLGIVQVLLLLKAYKHPNMRY